MERTKHGLFVFPPKKTLIWRRHCSTDQSCCSMTSKQFLESSSGMKFVYPSVRLANQKPGAFVSVRYTNQIALFPFVCCFCFVRAFHFKVHSRPQCLRVWECARKLWETLRSNPNFLLLLDYICFIAKCCVASVLELKKFS